jgi:hypothetical protein
MTMGSAVLKRRIGLGLGLGLGLVLAGACAAPATDPGDPVTDEATVAIRADADDGIAQIGITVTRLSDGLVLYQSGSRPALSDPTSHRSYLTVSALLPADTDVILAANAYDADGNLLAIALDQQILTPDPGESVSATLIIQLDQ